jgi:hypothetical protein
VLIPNGLLLRARASLAPGIDRQKLVPGYPLLHRTDEDSRPEGTEVDSDDGAAGGFPEFSPPEPRL